MRYLILILCLSLWPMTSAAETEEPEHAVLVEDDQFELRAYAPKIVAEVVVEGDQASASSRAFRPLADYIFGNNTKRADIAMTAPVTQTASEEIAMTAPVTQTETDANRWTVAFVMPSKWTMDTLPVPNNPDVTLRETPAETLAVVRFNGRGRPTTQARKQAELEAWIAEKGYEIIGAPISASYDPPWTLPPFRRNEIMLPVRLGD